MPETLERKDCVIVGGGPAGMIAGLLLARLGVEVCVLEKHEDFLRDFRGDTIHPSTLKIMDELGIIDRFLEIPHRRMYTVSVSSPTGVSTLANFSRLPRPYNFVAFLPQWDFLDFIASEAERYDNFQLIREAPVTGLLFEGERVAGVKYDGVDGPVEVPARLVIGADGRSSTIREQADLELQDSRSPMDVLWFRISRRPGESVPFVNTAGGFASIVIDRDEYWQVAFCIPKGGYAQLRSGEVDVIADQLAPQLPVVAERFREEITTWDDVKLLSVSVNRLLRWYRDGLLCIGDAAHAMSPAGGVGINLAIQDAVAAARIIGPTLVRGEDVPDTLLYRVQQRRLLPARLIQAGQVRIFANLYPKYLDQPYSPPLVPRIIGRVSPLQKLLARIIGIGLRPERVGKAIVNAPKP